MEIITHEPRLSVADSTLYYTDELSRHSEFVVCLFVFFKIVKEKWTFLAKYLQNLAMHRMFSYHFAFLINKNKYFFLIIFYTNVVQEKYNETNEIDTPSIKFSKVQ